MHYRVKIEEDQPEDMRNKFGCISWQQCCLFKYQCYHNCKESLENIALKYALRNPAGCGDGDKVKDENFRNLLDDGKIIVDRSGD